MIRYFISKFLVDFKCCFIYGFENLEIYSRCIFCLCIFLSIEQFVKKYKFNQKSTNHRHPYVKMSFSWFKKHFVWRSSIKFRKQCIKNIRPNHLAKTSATSRKGTKINSNLEEVRKRRVVCDDFIDRDHFNKNQVKEDQSDCILQVTNICREDVSTTAESHDVLGRVGRKTGATFGSLFTPRSHPPASVSAICSYSQASLI